MNENNKKPTRKVGRPRKQVNKPKLVEKRQSAQTKLGPKKSAELLYKELVDHFETFGIYGIDDYTKEFIDYLWQNPSKTIYASDLNESRLNNINRAISQRSFSMYRWEALPTNGFIEDPMFEILITSKDCSEEIKSRPNPENIQIIVMEDIKYE